MASPFDALDPKSLNGSAILSETQRFIRRFVVLSDAQADAVTRRLGRRLEGCFRNVCRQRWQRDAARLDGR